MLFVKGCPTKVPWAIPRMFLVGMFLDQDWQGRAAWLAGMLLMLSPQRQEYEVGGLLLDQM